MFEKHNKLQRFCLHHRLTDVLSFCQEWVVRVLMSRAKAVKGRYSERNFLFRTLKDLSHFIPWRSSGGGMALLDIHTAEHKTHKIWRNNYEKMDLRGTCDLYDPRFPGVL